ncbi:MAG TPA: rhomboid family intramembrane serine protease [Verrucomicrobiae bacterium]|nr:rhomboid family intramembrane serine protease [Verrucomicrobiae bacterium]
MDNDVVLFWFVCFACAWPMVVIRARGQTAVARGWICIYAGILVVCVTGWWLHLHSLIYVAAALWACLVLTPGLLTMAYSKQFFLQQYGAAYRLARLIGWMHPADGWRERPRIVLALDLVQRGELAGGSQILQELQQEKSLNGLAATVQLYRLTCQWDELVAWAAEHHEQLKPHAQFLPTLLRAHAEAGDFAGMFELFRLEQKRIARLIPTTVRDSCRLVLFAFSGKVQLTQDLLAANATALPEPTRRFWAATAALAAGQTEPATRELEELLPNADPSLRLAIRYRLARPCGAPQPLNEAAEGLIQEAAREQGHEQSFGAQASLFSRGARATQLLLALNLVMFGAEIFAGGSSNPETLYRLGALFTPAAQAGQWWRLATALFLHFGALHLTMNMLALWLLGPFAEWALGSWRFLLVYLAAGICSMGGVVWFTRGTEEMIVGASGSIMALVGVTAALMLRGWLRERALTARRRLGAMALVIASQTLFDSVVPQVSMTAHLTGALLGFVLTLMLPDNLARASAAASPETRPAGGLGPSGAV